MCGIGGVIHFNNSKVNSDLLYTMNAAMKQRGPDDDGIFLEDSLGFCHVRLSIIDLSKNGHQPFVDTTERYVLVYNGEVYNYLEIKKQLESHFTFKTNTDTEVLLNAYIHWGKACLDKFNGMFAFAIYDKVEKTVFIARDRFGIKPLYYYCDEKQFVFCSDIQPILKVCNAAVTINESIVYDYLLHDRVQHSENTFFQQIKKLQHGHFIEIKQNKPTISRWYHLRDALQNPFVSSEEYRESLTESIKIRLQADVAVGACLSGGLDSSSIVSLMLRNSNQSHFSTFSAIYQKGQQGDESDFIDLYRNSVDTMVYARPNSSELVQDMEKFIYTLAEPVPSTSVYAQYKVMEAAKGKAVVLLNGQGADESLAGYHYFFGYYFKELINQFRFSTLINEFLAYTKKHKSTLAYQSLGYFLLPDSLKEKMLVSKKGYFSKDFIASQQMAQRSVEVYQFLDAASLKESFINHFEHKLEHLLLWGDKCSMAFSLELRFPFLDHNLVEKTIGMKNEQLINNGTTKYILREAMKDVLPEKIRTRNDKIGFSTPESNWFTEPTFKAFSQDVFHSQFFLELPYINNKVFLKKLNGLYSGMNPQFSKEAWKMLHLALWNKEFLN